MKKLKDIKVVFDGEFFEELRKEKNIDRKQLCTDLNILPNDLCSYIHGRSRPSLDRLYQIAIYLDCIIEDLIKEVQND